MRLDLKKFFFGDDVMQNINYSFNMSETEWDGYKPFVSDVQVNGKIRARINVAADIAQADALALAKGEAAVAKEIEGKTIIKELYVPKRLVNIVVK